MAFLIFLVIFLPVYLIADILFVSWFSSVVNGIADVAVIAVTVTIVIVIVLVIARVYFPESV